MNILPSYKCNFKCSFCAVRSLDKGDLLDLNWLETTLNSIENISNIDILGGEPSLLPLSYQERLINICSARLGGKKPNMYTNLKIITPFIDRVDPVISYDINVRQDEAIVLANMISLDTDFNINAIVTRQLVAKGAPYLLKFANRLKRLKQIKLSSFTHFTGYPDLSPDPQELIDFVSYILKYDTNYKIRFFPISSIRDAYKKNTAPEQVAEILPDQRFRISMRDFHNAQEFDTFDEVVRYHKENYNFIDEDCRDCRFLGKCLHKYKKESCYWDYKLMEIIERSTLI